VGSNPTPSARKPDEFGLSSYSLNYLCRFFMTTKQAEIAKLIAKQNPGIYLSCFLARENEVPVST